MKNVLKIFMLVCFVYWGIALTCLNEVEADSSPNDIFENFVPTNISSCYYLYEEYDDNGNFVSLRVINSLYIYVGTNLGSPAYIIIDKLTNTIFEYSLNSPSPWHTYSISDVICLYSWNRYHILANIGSGTYYYCDGNVEIEHLTSEFVQSLSPLEIINLEDRPWIMNNNIIKSHTIENGFYFQKLNSNFGDNVYGSCSFVAYGMLLSYYNEFVDNQIIPETLQLYNNDSPQNYFKADVYNKSYGNSYNIRNAESPGTNELFHQFLLKYGATIFGEYKYGLNYYEVEELMQSYLDDYYDGNLELGIRKVNDVRFINSSEYDDYFEENYNYYANVEDKNELIKTYYDEDTLYTIEYNLDIIKELDNNNPVLLIFCTPMYYDTDYCFEYYGYGYASNGETYDITVTPSGGHAVIAYGYIKTNDQIYYRCHMGWDKKIGDHYYSDIYVSSENVAMGYALKNFSTETNVESSSYYYDNGECLINLPTDEIYETYDEFVKNEGNVEFNNTTEYYYCNCEEKHLLYQCGHNYHCRKIDDSTHQKYCHCGYNYIENHTIEHTTSTTYDHYAYCIDCSYHDYFAEGITYYVGEDPYGIPEYYHTWSCSVCNLSGVYNHTLEFESLGENYHRMNCRYCEYSDVAPHGCGYNVEIYYNKIGDNLHMAYCIGCKEEWIETHIGCNCHL